MTIRTYLFALLFAVALVSCGDDAGESPSEGAGTDTATQQGGREPVDSQTVFLSTTPPITKYGVRRGTVVYANSHLDRRQTLYFDEFGGYEAIYTDAKEGDSTDVPFDVSIYASGWRIDYNGRERSGIAKNQPNARGAILGLLPDLRAISITPIGKRTVAGREASGVSYQGQGTTRAWLWKAVPLRIEQPINGGADTLVLEAVSIDTSARVGMERFTVPENIAITRLK